MNKKTFFLVGTMALLLDAGAFAQDSKTVNDSNSPLHLMQPDYKIPYRIATEQQVKEVMDRVLCYLEECTPARIVDGKTGKTVTDYSRINADSRLAHGDFRLTSYEWGVTYSAMLAAAEATGDKAYAAYVAERFRLLSESAPYFKKVMKKSGDVDGNMRRVLSPGALDDSGAMCAAMIKAASMDSSLKLTPLIENYMDYIMKKQYRLPDGMFARTRPFHNSVWLDDMFMGIPPLAWYAKMTGDNSYADEAVRQINRFASRMWVKDSKLFRHGWVEAMADHPSFFWARANGWALLTMCEVLDALPENHPGRAEVLWLFREHARSLASMQGKDGFWHQLLDRNDSYFETSATAIYVYCLARAINKGWIDASVYGPVAMLGWNAVATKVTDKGQVEDTCVGTGMGFDCSFYYYRPVSVFAAHGYGPVIWAGAEMVNLLRSQHPKSNDSAVMFYKSEQKATAPIFEEE